MDTRSVDTSSRASVTGDRLSRSIFETNPKPDAQPRRIKGPFHIRRVDVKKSGRAYVLWKVDGCVRGVRYRKHFAKKDEAESKLREMNLRAVVEIPVAKLSVSHLSPPQLRDAEAAFFRLQERHSMTFAVDWFLRNYRETLTKMKVAEVVQLFLDDKADHLRPVTLRGYRQSLARFSRGFGKRRLPEVRTEHITIFLAGLDLKGRAWNNSRADLHTFFAWCEKSPRKWILENPAKDVVRFRVTHGLPEILSAKATRALFEFLEHYTGSPTNKRPAGWLVPFFALAVFGGIRVSLTGGEMTRLAAVENRERVIDLRAGVIRITPDVAKTKDLRQVEIQPNLAAWLTRYPIEQYPILPRNSHSLVAEIHHRLKLPKNVLRHTFISMHVAKFRSMADAALQAGNSEYMIKKYYFNLVTREEAEEFWSIMPSSAQVSEVLTGDKPEVGRQSTHLLEVPKER